MHADRGIRNILFFLASISCMPLIFMQLAVLLGEIAGQQICTEFECGSQSTLPVEKV